MTTLDQLLRDADRARPAATEAIDLGRTASELRDAILATEPTPVALAADARRPADPIRPRRAHRPARTRRRWPALVGATAALAVAAVFAVGAIDRLDRVAPSSGQAWAAEAVKVAKAVPRLLPTEPGWTVARADEFSVENGSFSLVRGAREVELNWYPIKQYAFYFKDRQLSTERFADATVAGHQAAMFRYDDSDVYFAMWKSGDYFVEARAQHEIPPEWKDKPLPAGEGMGGPELHTNYDEQSFRAFVTGLRDVGVDDWLAAMPATVVKPQDHAAEIARMLEGVPTPKNFDRAALEDDQAIRDRYQLGARVAGAVLCSWVKEWQTAERSGDDARERAARQAMGTAPGWAVFARMGAGGAPPEMLAQDAVAFSKGQSPNKQLPFGEFYRQQFCQTM